MFADVKNNIMPFAMTADAVYVSAAHFGINTGIVSWLGYAITKVSPLDGFGFGAVVGVVTKLLTPLLTELLKSKLQKNERQFNLSKLDHEDPFEQGKLASVVAFNLSILIGSAFGYALSAGAASAGFVAAPITLSGAALCIVSLMVVQTSRNHFKEAAVAYEIKKRKEQYDRVGWGPASP